MCVSVSVLIKFRNVVNLMSLLNVQTDDKLVICHLTIIFNSF